MAICISHASECPPTPFLCFLGSVHAQAVLVLLFACYFLPLHERPLTSMFLYPSDRRHCMTSGCLRAGLGPVYCTSDRRFTCLFSTDECLAEWQLHLHRLFLSLLADARGWPTASDPCIRHTRQQSSYCISAFLSTTPAPEPTLPGRVSRNIVHLQYR